jgi:hypothetical protein
MTNEDKESIVKNIFLMAAVLFSFVLMGCETVNKAGNAAGAVVGETANTVGSVTEGGAGAVQGEVTPEENPFNR